jgi:hypothetical protein
MFSILNPLFVFFGWLKLFKTSFLQILGTLCDFGFASQKKGQTGFKTPSEILKKMVLLLPVLIWND